MFSWSKGNKQSKQNNGSNSNLVYTRQQHITSYLTDATLKPSTRKVNEQTYDTVFQTCTLTPLILRVHLPTNITNPSSATAPKMSLVGIRAVHPWIDSKMRVIGYNRVVGSDEVFRQSGVLLGKVVRDVVNHFQVNPPDRLVIVDQGLKKLQESIGGANAGANGASNNAANNQNHTAPPPAYGSYRNQSQNNLPARPEQQQPQRQESINIQPPSHPLPPHFRQTLALSDADQRRLLSTLQNLQLPTLKSTNSDKTIALMVNKTKDRHTMNTILQNAEQQLVPNLLHLELVNETEEMKTTMSEANASMADSNLQTYKDKLETLEGEVKALQSSLKDKMDNMNGLQREQMELCKPMDTRGVVMRLKKAKQAAFEESEELAMGWLDGDGKVEDFLDEFLEVRTVHHVRAAKMERLEYPSS